MATKRRSETRPERLPDGAPLERAPVNEMGVVYLFSHLAKKFGVKVDHIRSNYPDCFAFKDGKLIKIEFEYKSRNFNHHRHDIKKCNWIVCWIHDWIAAPKRIRIVELRKEYNLGFNVWFQSVGPTYKDALSRVDRFNPSWSVASQAHEGDLVLFYRTAPDKCVRDIFRVAGPVGFTKKAKWKSGTKLKSQSDSFAPIRRICALKAPIRLSQLQNHKVLGSAGFVRGAMRSRYRATAHWDDLYRLIVETNPSLKKTLRRYEPSRVL